MVETFHFQKYFVRVIYKKIKHTYLRIDNKQVVITTAYHTNKSDIENFILQHQLRIDKMLAAAEAADKIYYNGVGYDKVKINSGRSIEFCGDKILYSSEQQLNNWYRKETHHYFQRLLQNEYEKIKEKIAFPKLKVRKMKTRWGVCNRKNRTITLNLDLNRFEEAVIRYVILHELLHFIYPYHNQAFWLKVASYNPDYQAIRKKLKN